MCAWKLKVVLNSIMQVIHKNPPIWKKKGLCNIQMLVFNYIYVSV